MSDFTKSRISGHDNWSTPEELYNELDQEFHFTDDPCPLMGAENADGLLREWGEVVFMNPPYSKPEPWVMKAVLEMRRGKTVVGLLRGDTSTKWFHKWVLPYAELRFIKGRLRFNNAGPAPFASIIAVWRPNKECPCCLGKNIEKCEILDEWETEQYSHCSDCDCIFDYEHEEVTK